MDTPGYVPFIHGQPFPRPTPIFFRCSPTDGQLCWLGVTCLLGYTEEELPRTREGWLALVHDEDRGRVMNLGLPSGTDTETHRADYRVRGKDSTYRMVREEAGKISEQWIVGRLQLLEGPSMHEDSLHFSLESLPVGILLVDRQGAITYSNLIAERCFGYERCELSGQSIEILIPQVLRDNHVRLRQEYFRDPEPRAMPSREIRGLRKNGEEIPVAIGLSPMPIANDLSVVVTVVELTSLKQAEHDLERFFAISPDLFCIANLAGHFLRVNDNFTRVLGYPASTLLSRPFLEFVHEGDREATQREIDRLAQGDRVIFFQNRYSDQDGEYHNLEWTARATEDGTIFAVARDISDRVDLQNEIISQEARERAILDSTSAVVYVKDLEGRYLFINQQFSELFNITQEQICGRSDADIFPPDIAQAFMANDREVLASGERMSLREVAPHADGNHQYISVKMPLRNHNGVVTGLAGISTDITDQIRAQEAEQQLLLARVFQEKLYPACAPAIAGLDVAGSAVPVSQVCGDYFDYIRQGDRCLMVAVGDVSGHGFGPALQMVEVRTALRIHLRESGCMSRAVDELNRMLCEDLPPGNFVTLFLVEVNLERNELRYIGAGHQAFLFKAKGDFIPLRDTGPLLGVEENADFSEIGVVPFEVGDLLLLFTDGLTEAANVGGDEFGNRRVQEAVLQCHQGAASAVVRHLFDTVYHFAHGRAIQDDITAISVKRTA
jgi:PAS domain S-box-containing protein